MCIFLVHVKVIFYKTMHKKKVEQYVQGEFLAGCEQKLKKKRDLRYGTHAVG